MFPRRVECNICDKPFYTTASNALYCSARCKRVANISVKRQWTNRRNNRVGEGGVKVGTLEQRRRRESRYGEYGICLGVLHEIERKVVELVPNITERVKWSLERTNARRRKPFLIGTCEECWEPFLTKLTSRRFCSRACQNARNNAKRKDRKNDSEETQETSIEHAGRTNEREDHPATG